MKRGSGSFIAIILLFFSALPAWGQLTVSLQAPTLGPGMESLQTMIDANLSAFSGDIAAYASDSYNKPLFMDGFSRSAAVAVLIPGAMHDSELPFAFLGGSIAVFALDYSGQSLSRLTGMTPDSDIDAGGNIQPFMARIDLPLSLPVKGFDIALSMGVSDARADPYELQAFSAGLDLGWGFGGGSSGIARWEGVRVGAGVGMSLSNLSSLISPGRILKTVPVDPDGDIGPLVPFNATFYVDPEIRAGINTKLGDVHIQAATSMSFFKALSLTAGAGLSWAFANSSISLEVNDAAIAIDGYLANLVDAPGSIDISGTISQYGLSAIDPYLCAGLRFMVGSFSVSLPFVWRIPSGLGTGLYIGLSI